MLPGVVHQCYECNAWINVALMNIQGACVHVAQRLHHCIIQLHHLDRAASSYLQCLMSGSTLQASTSCAVGMILPEGHPYPEGLIPTTLTHSQPGSHRHHCQLQQALGALIKVHTRDGSGSSTAQLHGLASMPRPTPNLLQIQSFGSVHRHQITSEDWDR